MESNTVHPLKKKYVPVEISGIITGIAKQTAIEGYTVGVLEAFIPESDLPEKVAKKWIKDNNKRMRAIIKFLNDNDL